MKHGADKVDTRAGEFLASASHELRTPLNAIVGMLELSLGEPLPVTLRDYLTTARDSARSLAISLDALRDLSRAENGTLRFLSNPLNLEELLSDTLAPLQQVASDDDRELTAIVAPTLPAAVEGDRQRLSQIIYPLVQHAYKWLDTPRIVVELTGSPSADHCLDMEIGISEFGVGQPADRQRYSKFKRTKHSKFSAAALGLSMAQCWLQQLDGDLWTDANGPDSGRFYGTLKLRYVDDSSASRSDSQLDQPHPNLHRPLLPCSQSSSPDKIRRSLHILVADDTEANQKVVKAMLTKRGHSVALADNGRQALDLVRHQPFDVILMDAQMPAMNGLEAASAIRQIPDDIRSKVPIIAMTAHALPEDRDLCLAAGMNDYLAKPLDVAVLINRVELYGNADREEIGVSLPAVDPQKDQNFLAGALARLGGDETLLMELVRLFRKDADALQAKLRAALKAQDAEAVARAAHNIRGLAANFDDNNTTSAAAILERAAARGDLLEAIETLPTLETSLCELLSALDRYQATPPHSELSKPDHAGNSVA